MATTNWSKVDRLELRLRMGVAMRLMDRVGYEEVRGWLSGEGVGAAELPSDRTMRDYMKGAEATSWAKQRAADILRETPGDGLATLEERVSVDNQARGLCMAMDELQDRLHCSSELRARLAMVREHVADAEYQLEALRDRGVAPESADYVAAAENLAYWLTRQQRLWADPDRLATGMTLRVVSQTIRLMDRAVALSRQEREEREAAASPAEPPAARAGAPAGGTSMPSGIAGILQSVLAGPSTVPQPPTRPVPSTSSASAAAGGRIQQDSVGIRQGSAALAPSPAPVTAGAGATVAGKGQLRPASAATTTSTTTTTTASPSTKGGIRQDSVGIRQGSAVRAPSPAPGTRNETVATSAPGAETAERAPETDAATPRAGLNRAQRRALKRRRDSQRSGSKAGRA